MARSKKQNSDVLMQTLTARAKVVNLPDEDVSFSINLDRIATQENL